MTTPVEPCPSCEDGIIVPDDATLLVWTCDACGYHQVDADPLRDAASAALARNMHGKYAEVDADSLLRNLQGDPRAVEGIMAYLLPVGLLAERLHWARHQHPDLWPVTPECGCADLAAFLLAECDPSDGSDHTFTPACPCRSGTDASGGPYEDEIAMDPLGPQGSLA